MPDPTAHELFQAIWRGEADSVRTILKVRPDLVDAWLNLLPRATIQPLIDELKQEVDGAAHAAVEQGVLDPAQTFADAPFETRLALVCKACSERNWAWEQYPL